MWKEAQLEQQQLSVANILLDSGNGAGGWNRHFSVFCVYFVLQMHIHNSVFILNGTLS